MLNEPIYEEENENTHSFLIDSNIKTASKSFNTSFDKTEFNKRKNIIQEKEIDELSDLKEKYKSILLKNSLEDGEDHLIYGMNVNLLTKSNKIKNGIIFCDDETFLQFLYPKYKKNPLKMKLNITSISDITIGKSVQLKNMNLPLLDKCCLTIHYSENLKHYDLIFFDSNKVELFIFGILTILQKRAKEGNIYDSDLLSLKRIWKEYDPQHNKFLNVNQFSDFLKNINFDFKGKTAEQIFKEIDKEKKEKITFKEFIFFYEFLVTGEEFIEVFQKYSSDVNKNYITIKGIIDFYEKEQNVILSSEDAMKIIYKYGKAAKKLNLKNFYNKNTNNNNNKNINSKFSISNNENTESMVAEYENHTFIKNELANKLSTDAINNNSNINNNNNNNNILKIAFKLSFREFVNLLIDKKNNSIFDKEKMILNHNDLNHPLYDYYCNSSHNTYLTGNQLTGGCSVEMYAYALKNGSRFIDLDTFDGSNDEPIITHWHFPVGEINFKEVLICIKENAFIKNNLPVVLSLENHCGSVCQEKMERYFLEILGRENLYIIDNKYPPVVYPSPNDLLNKFVIKNKRKRIYGDLANMKIYNNNNNNNNGVSNVNNNNINVNEESRIVKKYLLNNLTKDVIDEEENVSNYSDDDDINNSIISEGKIEIKIGNKNYPYKFLKTLNSFQNIFPSNQIQISFQSENPNLSFKKKTRKKSTNKENNNNNNNNNNINNISNIPPMSNNILKKLKIKYTNNNNNNNISNINNNNNNNNNLNISYNNEIQNEILKKIEKIQIADSQNPQKIHIITIDRLANILGMVGVKYHKEIFNPEKFLPWECISICESDMLKYITNDENKEKLISYCQRSFLKIYPDGFRVNSFNQNPVLCWGLGCQFCALNIQTTEDDMILLNKMFFKTNGGSKCGYVLKPEYMRQFDKDKFYKFIRNRKYRIKFKILSGFHLHLTIPKKEKITGMFIEVSLITPRNYLNSYNNNNNNNNGFNFYDLKGFNKEVKLVTNIINNNFLHPIWESNSVLFDIYEPELSFFIVKLMGKKKNICLARAVIPVSTINFGYRVLEIYDKTCTKFDESYLIIKVNKIFC